MRMFEGLKVIDAAGYIAAPAAATILADFGADVIKLEPPGEGDGFRKVYKLPNMPVSEHNYMWMQVARSRRGIALDLRTQAGQAVLHRLIEETDVFITNAPPPSRKRLGITYDQLSGINPRLIYGSLTGYGETGPEAGRPGFDATTYWARSGLTDIVRTSADAPPASAANGMGDQPAGAMLFGGIAAALYRRERTGKGAEVTTSLIANGAWANAIMIQGALVGAEVEYRQPRTEPRNALQNFYLCGDGRWFILSLIAEEKLWPLFAEQIGRPDLISDPRFALLPDRRKNARDLTVVLDQIFPTRSSAEWQKQFDSIGLTASVIAKTGDVAHDQQMRAAKALLPGEGIPGTGLTVDSPVQISGEEKRLPQRPPELGEHSEEILRQAGFSATEIAELRAAGAFGA